MADNHNSTCEGDSNHIGILLQGSAMLEQKRTDTLEDIKRQFEIQTQYNKGSTLSDTKQDTYAANMTDNTQHNNSAEIKIDCTFNMDKTNTLYNIIVGKKNEENDEITKWLK